MSAPQKALRKLGLVPRVDRVLRSEGETVQSVITIATRQVTFTPRGELLMTADDDSSNCALRWKLLTYGRMQPNINS